MSNLNLKQILKNKLEGAERVAVLGVGSELRADDFAGIIAAQQIEKKCGNDGKCKVFYGATAPENLTGEIKKYQPTHLVIIDAADTSSEPGTIMFIRHDELAGISFSTHMMPLKIMVDYLLESFKCDVTVIGIQPKSLEFGKSPSKEITASARQVAKAFSEVI